jgi:hypothetical protein
MRKEECKRLCRGMMCEIEAGNQVDEGVQVEVGIDTKDCMWESCCCVLREVEGQKMDGRGCEGMMEVEKERNKKEAAQRD